MRWLRLDTCRDWHAEILSKLHDRKFADLEDAFYRRIPFGTAGQRGPVGAGPNRVNTRTIAESAQGVCDYARHMKPSAELSAVVAYDTRADSAWFAQVVTEVLVGSGIRVYLFEKPVPTPELSHAVIILRADFGFMLSASHNPPTDNGMKVYWDYGGQVLPEDAEGITEMTERVRDVKMSSLDEAYQEGTVQPIGPEIDESYRQAVLQQGMTTGGDVPERQARIVFSPLHGTGESSVIPVLEAAGWTFGEDLFIVQSQRRPDPKFRGVPDGIPNPEAPESLQAGVAVAESVGADLVIATDPDADRLAIQIVGAQREGVPNFLKGGQLSAILAEWVLSQLAAQDRLPDDGLVVRNVVTSDIVDDVAEHYGVRVENNLPVGFKYVAKVSAELEDTPERFIFGTEQSYGSLRGMHCRDKDGAVVALLVAELCDDLKRAGRTIFDLLAELWLRHGYYAERATPIRMEGISGLKRIGEIMTRVREEFPAEVAGARVTEVWDLLTDRVIDPVSGDQTRALGWGWKDENVLIGRLDVGEKSWIAIRPSGTEPALKIYVNVHALVEGETALPDVAKRTEEHATAIESALMAWMGLPMPVLRLA